MLTAKQALWAILFGSPFSPFTSAQNTVEPHRNCSSAEHLTHQMAIDANMKERRERIEAHTADYVQRTPSVSERSVITIPVVVHVLYNSSRDNISDAQILSQIDVLNRDFRKNNAESANIPSAFQSIAADVNIEFCLAKRQPNGTATTGIERLASSNAAWQANDDMKRPEQGGLAAWDATRYLNIWVCALNGGALGYATFPGAPLSSDGVVVDYRYFGTINTRSPFHLGRTTTHEVGHWLNLYHIWGDAACGDDRCADTPPHHGANYGCPNYPYTHTACGSTTPEMTMNFMDYTNDACMYLFSNGQKARMLSLFAVGGARRGIVEGNVCANVTPPSVCALPTNFLVSNVSAQSVTVNWTAATDNAAFTLEYRRATDINWTSVTNITANSFTINNLQAATIYQVRLKAVCKTSLESQYSTILIVQTLEKIILPPPPPFLDCGDNYEPNNTLSTAKPIDSNLKTTGLISDVRDRDWFAIKITAGTTVKITLSGLPNDYDMRLFDSRLRLVQSSENQGTADENMSYTAVSGQGNLLLYIYGYNGASHADKCYSLQISTVSSKIEPINLMNFRENKSEKGQNTEGVRMSPNPTSGLLNIELPNENAAIVQVFTPTGQLFLTQKREFGNSENQLSVDLSNAVNGVYLVKIVQNGVISTQKIVIFKN